MSFVLDLELVFGFCYAFSANSVIASFAQEKLLAISTLIVALVAFKFFPMLGLLNHHDMFLGAFDT